MKTTKTKTMKSGSLSVAKRLMATSAVALVMLSSSAMGQDLFSVKEFDRPRGYVEARATLDTNSPLKEGVRAELEGFVKLTDERHAKIAQDANAYFVSTGREDYMEALLRPWVKSNVDTQNTALEGRVPSCLASKGCYVEVSQKSWSTPKNYDTKTILDIEDFNEALDGDEFGYTDAKNEFYNADDFREKLLARFDAIDKAGLPEHFDEQDYQRFKDQINQKAGIDQVTQELVAHVLEVPLHEPSQSIQVSREELVRVLKLVPEGDLDEGGREDVTAVLNSDLILYENHPAAKKLYDEFSHKYGGKTGDEFARAIEPQSLSSNGELVKSGRKPYFADAFKRMESTNWLANGNSYKEYQDEIEEWFIANIENSKAVMPPRIKDAYNAFLASEQEHADFGDYFDDLERHGGTNDPAKKWYEKALAEVIARGEDEVDFGTAPGFVQSEYRTWKMNRSMQADSSSSRSGYASPRASDQKESMIEVVSYADRREPDLGALRFDPKDFPKPYAYIEAKRLLAGEISPQLRQELNVYVNFVDRIHENIAQVGETVIRQKRKELENEPEEAGYYYGLDHRANAYIADQIEKQNEMAEKRAPACMKDESCAVNSKRSEEAAGKKEADLESEKEADLVAKREAERAKLAKAEQDKIEADREAERKKLADAEKEAKKDEIAAVSGKDEIDFDTMNLWQTADGKLSFILDRRSALFNAKEGVSVWGTAQYRPSSLSKEGLFDFKASNKSLFGGVDYKMQDTTVGLYGSIAGQDVRTSTSAFVDGIDNVVWADSARMIGVHILKEFDPIFVGGSLSWHTWSGRKDPDKNVHVTMESSQIIPELTLGANVKIGDSGITITPSLTGLYAYQHITGTAVRKGTETFKEQTIKMPEKTTDVFGVKAQLAINKQFETWNVGTFGGYTTPIGYDVGHFYAGGNVGINITPNIQFTTSIRTTFTEAKNLDLRAGLTVGF